MIDKSCSHRCSSFTDADADNDDDDDDDTTADVDSGLAQRVKNDNKKIPSSNNFQVSIEFFCLLKPVFIPSGIAETHSYLLLILFKGCDVTGSHNSLFPYDIVR